MNLKLALLKKKTLRLKAVERELRRLLETAFETEYISVFLEKCSTKLEKMVFQYILT